MNKKIIKKLSEIETSFLFIGEGAFAVNCCIFASKDSIDPLKNAKEAIRLKKLIENELKLNADISSEYGLQKVTVTKK